MSTISATIIRLKSRQTTYDKWSNRLGYSGQKVGIKPVSDKIWLVSFMHHDLGYFDHETCRLEPTANPLSPKVLPMSPVRTLGEVDRWNPLQLAKFSD